MDENKIVPAKPPKLVIYTVLVGDKEPLGRPLEKNLDEYDTDLEITFVCFTDNQFKDSEVWELRDIESNYLSPEKNSRSPKILPHKYFPEYQYSLYIDNSITLKRLPTSDDLVCEKDYLFKLFKHEGRGNLSEEALAIVGLGYDNVEIIAKQLLDYSKYIDPKKITPLSTCPVMIRTHMHPEVIKFSELWWTHFLTYSKRDQMSFDFIRIMSNAQVSYFSGTTTSNDLTLPHLTLNPNRILANFDYEKYGYIQNLKLKNSDLAKHYLSQKPSLEQAFHYARVNSILEYFAYIHNSGISARAYPRRDLIKILESAFIKYKSAKQLLFINVLESDFKNDKWKDEEIDDFKKVLASYFSNTKIFTLEVSRKDIGALKTNIKKSWPDLKAQAIVLINTETTDMQNIGALMRSEVMDAKGTLVFLNHVYPVGMPILDSALTGLSITSNEVVSCHHQSELNNGSHMNIAHAITIEWNIKPI